MWYFEEDSEGYCKIKSKQSGKCLDVSGMSTDNGARLQLWTDVDGDNQKWKVIPLDEDTDEDGIINSKELELGTNIFNYDTDGDGLSDGFEVNSSFTDPLNKNSKDENISDDLLDLDNDKLSNIQEQNMKLNPLEEDSDFDGLSDYDEINLYKTNPSQYDTDGEGLGDGTELKEGFNPLKRDTDDNGIIDSEENITIDLLDKKYDSLDKDKLGYMPEIKITGKGDYNSKVSITDVSKIDNELPDVDYIIGTPIKIDHEDDIKFDNAEINFTLSDDILKNQDINNLAIAYYDEKNKVLQPLETKIDSVNKKLTVNTNHFSYYFIIDINKWKKENFITSENSELNVGMCDVVFVLDSTGSMGGTINNLKNSIISFAQQMEVNNIDVRFGLVEFKDISCGEKTIDHGFFSSSTDLKNELSKITASGEGDTDESAVDALETARRMSFRNNSMKHFILITDAGYKDATSFDGIKSMQQVVDNLRVDNIAVSVVSTSSNENIFKLLYQGTEGKFLNRSSDFSSSLLTITKDIADKYKGYTWVRLSDGTVVKLNVNPANVDKNDTTDTDGDGVPDVKELTGKVEKEFNGYKYTVWTFKSNPAVADWIIDEDTGEKIISPLYSEKYIDSDNTFSANEMTEAIKKISSVMNTYINESYFSDMKAKDRVKIVNNAVLYYLQKGSYNSTLWKMLNLKDDFSSILAYKLDLLTDEFKKYHKTHLIDPKTGEDIDFTHLAASLNAHYINGDSYLTMPIELASWGGDLQTLLVDVADDSHGKSDYDILSESCKKLLGSQDNSGSFDISDVLSDIDAVNLSKELKSNNSEYLYKAFFSYYENGKCYTRFTEFINYYGKDGLKNKIIKVLPDDKVITDSNTKPIFWSKVTLDYYLMKDYFCDENYDFRYWPTISTVKALRDYFYKYVETQANLE